MKYLVPTDFSDNARNAAEYAAALAKKTQGGIIYLHIVIPIGSERQPQGNVYADKVKEKRNEAKEQLQKISTKVQLSYPGITTNFIIRTGEVSDEIMNAAQTYKADMIVMGTRGASGLKKFFFGSNTASVIEESNIPVLIIPENVSFMLPKKIVFATDYYDSDFIALKKLSKVASSFNAEIVIVHIATEKELELELSMIDYFSEKVSKTIDYPKITYKVIVNENISKGIESFVENEKTDILALSTRKRNPFEKLFNKSITKEFSYHSKIPLLAFRIDESIGESDF